MSAGALSGCLVGPDYKRPAAVPPVSGAAQTIDTGFKEAPDGATPWRPAQPMDAIDRTGWWKVYGDPVLNDLEAQVETTNQNVAAAAANYRQSAAIVAQSRASFFPTVGLSSSITRSGGGSSSNGGTIISTGGGTVVTGGTTGTTGTGVTGTGTTGTTGTGTTTTSSGSTAVASNGGSQTRYNIGANVAWEPDLWGRIRRTVEANASSAQASAADLAAATLLAQAQLAGFYFDLRLLDEQQRLLADTLTAYNRSLKLTQNQYNAGIVARGDVIAAQTQVQNAQAQLIDLGVQRTAREHAIAVLIGKPPSALTLAIGTLPPTAPTPPTTLQSALLERRPDIAGAERAVQSANALIGVQIAAYYPNISLGGSATSSNTDFSSLFNASNVVWSFGPQLAYTLFDFGARKAQVRQARAVYDRTVADYRQTTLTAFQNVEDELSALRVLEQEQVVRVAAETSARQAEQIARNQYGAGLTSFTTVITAQTQSLAAQQTSLNVKGSRLQASVSLIQALGGGWTTAELPKASAIR